MKRNVVPALRYSPREISVLPTASIRITVLSFCMRRDVVWQIVRVSTFRRNVKSHSCTLKIGAALTEM
jgi:hypothetical protein